MVCLVEPLKPLRGQTEASEANSADHCLIKLFLCSELIANYGLVDLLTLYRGRTDAVAFEAAGPRTHSGEPYRYPRPGIARAKR